jgi:hypothetical protein
MLTSQSVYILADDTVHATPSVENVTRDLAGREGGLGLGEAVACLCPLGPMRLQQTSTLYPAICVARKRFYMALAP